MIQVDRAKRRNNHPQRGLVQTRTQPDIFHDQTPVTTYLSHLNFSCPIIRNQLINHNSTAGILIQNDRMITVPISRHASDTLRPHLQVCLFGLALALPRCRFGAGDARDGFAGGSGSGFWFLWNFNKFF